MGRRNASKKPRGNRGVVHHDGTHAPCVQDSRDKGNNSKKYPYHDLMVILPKASLSSASDSSQTMQSQLLMRQVVDRLAYIGYSTIAFVHTVYGRPKPKVDNHDIAIPNVYRDTFYERPCKRKRRTIELEKTSNLTRTQQSSLQPPIKILKRIHAVVENLSDVGAYTLQSSSSETGASSLSNSSPSWVSLLEDYDIVSISPRNDATFQAACASATAAGIVTLDYTAGRGGIQLPFTIRSSDIKALVARGAALELPYAPALLHPHQQQQRLKTLVQTARQVQVASAGIRPKPRILFSSGDRTITDHIDVGAMALRAPGDLINVLQTVLCFDRITAYDALSRSAALTANSHHHHHRVTGKNNAAAAVVVDVDVLVDCGGALGPTGGKASKGPLAGSLKDSLKALAVYKEEKATTEEDGKENLEDGFITLA